MTQGLSDPRVIIWVTLCTAQVGMEIHDFVYNCGRLAVVPVHV